MNTVPPVPGSVAPGAPQRQRPGSASDRPCPEIPHHELLRPIGRGSYGEVWLARNLMGTYRAVKILWRGSFKDSRPFERELAGIRRFEPISRLHEGFVDILHVGLNQDETCFFYVMELGDDQGSGQEIKPDNYRPRTLATDIGVRGRLPLEACLGVGLALSKALAQLHASGLVHRDIKPSNIIFVGGVPKLADIGLVMEAGVTASYVGTEGFIPPEGPSSPQADVYALGKVLYEAATGKDRQDFPALPADWGTPEEQDSLMELNEVLIRACHGDP